MKITAKLQLVLVVPLLIMSTAGVAAADASQGNDTDTTVLTTAVDSLNAYTSALGDSSVSIESVISKGKDAQAKLGDVESHGFLALSSDYTQACDALKQDATTLISDIGAIDSAVQANDEKTANAKLDQLNSDGTKLDSDTTAFNTAGSKYYADPVSLLVAYILLFVGTVGLSIGSFIWARRSTPNVALKHARMTIAKLSLSPIIGAALTLGTYLAARNGGTYLVAWGPIGIGAIIFLQAVARYRKSLPTLLSAVPATTAYAAPAQMQPGGPGFTPPPPTMPVNPNEPPKQ